MNRHTIAPLNLSTTVEGSLVGLRESLVTLSAALEAQGRRLEHGFATEGLRVSEEVGSLKAVVQGLRMQVNSNIAVLPRTRIWYPGGTLSVCLACGFTRWPCEGTSGRWGCFPQFVLVSPCGGGTSTLTTLGFGWRERGSPSRLIT